MEVQNHLRNGDDGTCFRVGVSGSLQGRGVESARGRDSVLLLHQVPPCAQFPPLACLLLDPGGAPAPLHHSTAPFCFIPLAK